jgi:Na+/melibiose symporter-like transporter
VQLIQTTYILDVPRFLEHKFHLSTAFIGFFMSLDNIAAFLIQPPVGAWSDKLRTPIGRRMPFILVGVPISAVAFGLIPLAPVLLLFVACTSTLLLSMALWRTPVAALMPDLTPSPSRSQANGVINLMAGVGGIFAALGGAALGPKDPAYSFWMGSVLVILAMVLLFTFIKEPKIAEANEVEVSEVQPGLLESLKTVFEERDKSALFLHLVIFFLTLSYSPIESFFYPVCGKSSWGG